MSNSYFQFKQFTIHQDRSAMKVTTDSCLFGAWVADRIKTEKITINNCLDIGTGTGLLSLMLAQKIEATIDAIEIEEKAAQQAIENVANSPWKNNINISTTNATKFISKSFYDLIISNPPFYENELKSPKEERNIAHHSEELSLENLLTIIKKHLSPTGIFALLLPYKRLDQLKKLLIDYGFSLSQITMVKQSVSHDFFRIMLIGKLKSGEIIETLTDELAIKEDSKNGLPPAYTPEFIRLLKDYYLHL